MGTLTGIVSISRIFIGLISVMVYGNRFQSKVSDRCGQGSFPFLFSNLDEPANYQGSLFRFTALLGHGALTQLKIMAGNGLDTDPLGC